MKRYQFLAVTLAAAVLALPAPSFAQGRSRGGFRGSRGPASLLMMPEVQKELSLNDAQLDIIKTLSQESRRGGTTGGNRESFRNLSPEEREKRFAALREEREKASKEQEKKIAEVLDAKQLARLKQLQIQQAGTRALERAEVQDELKLSADQKQKIQATVTADREASRQAFGGFGGNNGQRPTDEQRQAAIQKLRDARAATDAKLLAVLTDPQKKQFQQMQGSPFKFPERTFGTRGGNGQNGGNGQRGRRPGGAQPRPADKT